MAPHPQIRPQPRSKYPPQSPTQRDRCEEIFHAIHEALSTEYDTQFERGLPPDHFWALFEMNWDIVGFVHLQDYNGFFGGKFSDAITLTGSSTDAFAAPASYYVEQTWPYTGRTLLRLFQETIDSGHRFSRFREVQSHLQ